ncbi:AAA family ATPase [Rossellomorea aquimaris]|uniref:AAA family ATPase n=1 Tax=Rossellomorea aquimaris TaxID=189382 RepID=UPI001CD62A66|nr:AAA family ATPase [Rossellomorea aquimaris]MCA1054313.1 AAA family ATPase [Rossellomorea aquimaris]
MYFSSRAINEFYPELKSASEGKINLERTSSLVYFLATDIVEKRSNEEVVDVQKGSPLRNMFSSVVSDILTFGTLNSEELQGNYLGEITKEELKNRISTKVGKNFLSTQVNRAAATGVTEYPTRPKNSALLLLGEDTDTGSTSSLKKHPDWQENLFQYIGFRICGEDTFPLIVFLLKNIQLDDTKSLEESIREALSNTFSSDVANFLFDNADIPDLEEDYFSENSFRIEDLDESLFRDFSLEDETGQEEDDITETGESESFDEITIPKDKPRNKIIYGAPGTGKSFALKTEIDNTFKSEELVERITFYQNYSYNQFIGSYKPVPLYREVDEPIYSSDKVKHPGKNFEPIIDYQFVPGPFISTLVKALKNPKSSFVLIIEEINRANAARVFGDAFQLLDRDEDGKSEYGIVFNPDVMNFLRSKGIMDREIKLPSNFFIWATMNSSDQGVNPMDTAFKRRWSFEYLPLDQNDHKMDSVFVELPFMEGEKVSWNKLRTTINDHIKDFVSEDKLLGPFFLKAHELNNIDTFKNKLLLYLRDDVLRYNHNKLFRKKNFSDIVRDFDDKKNIFIFSEDDLRSED